MKGDEITRKNLSINLSTYERLKARGKFGESFGDIIDRLLDLTEGKHG